ncbi:hypothetical protein [Knoellia sp. LjRoot47]|uniref:hypothetical protein n=1 Tax=Knoellia sp. LjRoot47 TaxID=3342330 RepID=UPI003ED07114
MDDSVLWLVGAVALVVVVAALIWVLRTRGGSAAPVHHGYEAPEVTETGQRGRSDVTFGGTDDTDAPIDQTVPRSRLGGAGWRDRTDAPVTRTTDSYAGESPSWADESSADGSDSPLEHHVAVDPTDADRGVDEELDRRRGGHW